MFIADIGSWFAARTRWEKAALAVWTALLLFVSVRVFISPGVKTVYPIFSASSRLWWAGQEVYEPHRPKDVPDGYRYSPAFTILLTPFALMSDALGGVAWRLFNAAALVGAFWWFGRALLPASLSRDAFAWLFILILPLALQSINNGQSNLLVAAGMLATLAAVKQKRWTLACVFIALAFVCKVYPIALGMVLVVLYPRQIAWRMPLAVLASVLATFLFQDTSYVADQYEKWFTLLRADDRTDIPLEHMYRDLWLLVHVYGLPIGRQVYGILQVAGGAGVALLCCYRQWAGWSERSVLISTLALATAWMMLLGPATESSSYALLAPSLAWSVVEAWQRTPWRWSRSWFAAFKATPGQWRFGLLWVSCLLFVVAIFFGSFRLTVMLHEWGIHVWATIFYVGYLLTEPRHHDALAAARPETWRAAA